MILILENVQKYLDKSYKLASTVGHIKDLPEKELGIDVENQFEPKYVTIKGKQKVGQKFPGTGNEF